jgi:uncharacterized coiled-coil DUF342 family protein
MARKKTKTELEVAELRYRSLIDKRNDLNRQASVVMDDIDKIRKRKNVILDDLKDLREEKAKLHDMIQEHKRKRDEFQRRAKELIRVKKSKRGKVSGDFERELRDMDRRISDMERRQETTFMSLADENELLDQLRDNVKERTELEQVVEEQRSILTEVKDIDLSIDELFKIANEEHEKIVNIFPRVDALNKKMRVEFKKVGVFLLDIKKKREVFIDLKTKADNYHKKASEMREKILTIKKATKKDIREARKTIKDHNVKVKKLLDDEKNLAKKADEALASLMKKGKIEL